MKTKFNNFLIFDSNRESIIGLSILKFHKRYKFLVMKYVETVENARGKLMQTVRNGKGCNAERSGTPRND